MPPRDTTGTTNQPLSDFVRDHLERTGMSRRQFGDQCRDPLTGQTLTHTYIGDLVSGRVPRAPELWRLRALAAGTRSESFGGGAGEDRRRLDDLKRMAAIQWLDLGDVLRVDTGEDTWVTVSVPEGLSERRRQQLIRWAENMARDLDQEEE